MKKKFQCPKCNMYFSSKQMLEFHLYKRKKPCGDQIDITHTSNTQIHTKMWDSKQSHTNQPENSRFIPVKLTLFPENHRFIPVKLPTFLENSRLTKNPVINSSVNGVEPNDLIVQKKDYFCVHCGHKFSRSDSLKRHSEKYCKMKEICDPKLIKLTPSNQPETTKLIKLASSNQSETTELIKLASSNQSETTELIKLASSNQLETTQLEKEITLLKKRIEEMEKNNKEHSQNYEKLKSEPRIIHNHNNQILQILCVGSNQNYLNMLTEQWGDYDKALCFIKDCALSSLIGDCKLLQKIYFSSDNPTEYPIKYLDKNRKKLEYLNENKKRIVDPQGTRLGKILANNLQNSYLQGVNYLINRTLENKNCPNLFLDEYDIQSWNNHIYELSDARYQKKIMGCRLSPWMSPQA